MVRNFEADDEIVEMSRLLGVPVERLSRSIGRGWYRATEQGDWPGQWFGVGGPPQVLLRILPDLLEVAGARIRWDGQVPRLQPVRVAERPRGGLLGEDLEWLSAQVAEAAERSQKRFAYCSLCRTVCAPEQLFQAEPPVCQGCGSLYFDVVY